MKQKYYVVWKGYEPGIYLTWEECKKQIDGFAGARYKSFEREEEAKSAFESGVDDYALVWSVLTDKKVLSSIGADVAWCVDASCVGNPGKMEYRCVEIPSRRVVFASKVYPRGTNNIGEFLAIVHALALMEQQGKSIDIFSDSKVAIGAAMRGKYRSTFVIEDPELLNVVLRAQMWLGMRPHPQNLHKWNTDEWGEIPADYNRK